MERCLIASVVVIGLCSVAAAGGQETLHEQVRSTPLGGHLAESLFPSYPAWDVPTVLKATDLVVEGGVVSASPRLNDDQRFVSTIYVLRVDIVTFDRQAGSPTPSPALTTVKVTHPGGTIELDGRIVEASDRKLLPFAVGTRLVLFLQKDRLDKNLYDIVDGPYGAFGVKDGLIQSFLQPSDPLAVQFAGKSVEVLRQAILSAAASGR